MSADPRLALYVAIAGAENAGHRIFANAREMIWAQGDEGKQLELVNEQLLLINVASAALLALRETLIAEKQGIVLTEG